MEQQNDSSTSVLVTFKLFIVGIKTNTRMSLVLPNIQYIVLTK